MYPVIVSAKFEVRKFVPELIGVAKNWSGPWLARILCSPQNPICLAYRLFSYVHFFPRFSIAVLNGRCEPPILGKGKGGHRGLGMVPFERALVSFYRPSIVTFTPSLRISEILLLLFSSTPLFPTPPLFSPKFPHVSLGIGGSPFRYKERRCWANCPCNYSFQDF